MLVSITSYFKVVRNSAKNYDGQTSKALDLELIWLLTPLLLDTASEVTTSLASEQLFSKTDNCKNIRDVKVTLSLHTHSRGAAEARGVFLLSSKSPARLTDIQPLQNT